MQRRIYASEMEWSLLTQMQAGEEFTSPTSGGDFLKVAYDYLPEGIDRIGQFLSNGARLYPDAGSHIEYATGEESTLDGIVTAEIAGERFMQHMLENVAANGFIRSFLLNKRVIDEVGNTWGYHENYLASSTLEISEEGLALLGLHTITRNLYTGAGAIVRGNHFLVAQKASSLLVDAKLEAHYQKEKPVINLRNEPHAQPQHGKRIHVTNGDPNMSPWAIRMRFGTTSLVLRLLEAGYVNTGIMPEMKLYQLGRVIAHDPTTRNTVVLQNGKTVRPIDIQTELMLAAKALAEKEYIPADERQVLVEWERACDELERDPDLLGDRVDWIAKKRTLERYVDKHGPSAKAELHKKDRQWDLIGRQGIGMKLREGPWQKWMPSEAKIAAAEKAPTTKTRAVARGRFIRAFAHLTRCEPGSASSSVHAEWSKVRLGGTTIELQDPLMARSRRINRLIHQQAA